MKALKGEIDGARHKVHEDSEVLRRATGLANLQRLQRFSPQLSGSDFEEAVSESKPLRSLARAAAGKLLRFAASLRPYRDFYARYETSLRENAARRNAIPPEFASNAELRNTPAWKSIQEEEKKFEATDDVLRTARTMLSHFVRSRMDGFDALEHASVDALDAFADAFARSADDAYRPPPPPLKKLRGIIDVDAQISNGS